MFPKVFGLIMNKNSGTDTAQWMMGTSGKVDESTPDVRVGELERDRVCVSYVLWVLSFYLLLTVVNYQVKYSLLEVLEVGIS